MNKRLGIMAVVSLSAQLAVIPMSYADVLWIPMATKIGLFKKEMKKSGYDLYGGDESDGFVEDLGTKIKIVTYKSVPTEDLNKFMDAATKARR